MTSTRIREISVSRAPSYCANHCPAARYLDLGADYFDHKQPEQFRDYHLRRLAELGYKVKLEQVKAA